MFIIFYIPGMMKKKSGIDSKMRLVDIDRPAVVRLDSKEILRQVVVDYLRRNIAGGSVKASRNIKHEPITVNSLINKADFTAVLEVNSIIAKCIVVAKKYDGESSMQELTKEIMKVFDKLTDQTILINMDMNSKPTSDKFLTCVVEAHWKERERKILQDEFASVKKTLLAKNKKVNFPTRGEQPEFNQFLVRRSEQNSQRVSRSTINCIDKENNPGRVKIPAASRSQLKGLIDTCNIFEHPEEVDAIRKQKYIQDYCEGKEVLLIEAKQQVRKTYEPPAQTTLTIHTAQLLEEWINEISLSQYLFKKRFTSEHNRDSATSTPFSGQSSAQIQADSMFE